MKLSRYLALLSCLFLFTAVVHAQTLTGKWNSTVQLSGQGAGGTILTNADLYDWTSGSWSTSASNMNAPHYLHTSTMLPNGRLLIAGGGIGGMTPSTVVDCTGEEPVVLRKGLGEWEMEVKD